MSLSDATSNDSSGDESSTPSKRPRADTYGASSTTSHGSVLQDSDNEPDTPNPDTFTGDFQQPNKSRSRFLDHSPEHNVRLSSRSSLSENCSSPNEQYDDYRPGFDDPDRDQGEISHKNSFQNLNETDYKYQGEYSDVIKKLMDKMGHKPGQGLGKYEHGRIEPVEASTQKGRRGLGLKPSVVGEVPQDFQWTPDDSKPQIQEELKWMSPAPDEHLSGDLLDEWLRQGPKKLIIDDETEFVQPHILKGVLDAKTIFNSLDDEDLRSARFRSNPYETIGSVIFLNRAAVKMANIDAICDFMFTNPKSQNNKDGTEKKELLYFADVCAGPGGFSEYVLYRKGWMAKGFGFTLKASNDFKISDFYAGTPESFDPYYGVKEDGNLFDPANLMSLKDHVLKQTEDKGVHFLMADGGFSVVGQENIQEILSKQLYLCQCLAALMLVRTGGHTVIKLFDIFTPFSVGLIYIMYRCFEKLCIIKPLTSRPANSERYLVCSIKRLGTKTAEDHLYHVNSLIWNKIDSTQDILELVPLRVIQEDTAFFDYIYRSNCMIGESQIKNLLKIAAFSKDKNLKEKSQAEIKEQCLKLWNLPDQVRKPQKHQNVDEMLQIILSSMNKPLPDSDNLYSFKTSVLGKSPDYLQTQQDLQKLKNVYDWHFMFLSSGRNSPDLKMFIGCGGQQVYHMDSNGWKNVCDVRITLPARTLLYGEIVKEYRGEGNHQMFSKCLHVIDALMLGGVDISHEALTERINQCDLFCTALNKPFNNESLPIRCKRMFGLEQFPTAVLNLECRSMKRIRRAVTIDTPDRINRNGSFYMVTSILFMKEIKEPWSGHMSKKSGYKYYYCMGKNGKPLSEYKIPSEAKLDMVSTYTNRVMWPWEEAAVNILNGDNQNGLTRLQLEEHIAHKINK